ncbi:hypothetical protein E6P09_01025 [Haloferax mediterranei ATCC 33500]|uniref:Uncharacterized protein n=1 Tax=Haloferax mediterranei (strain ATCC 33500 / DSM 1411 / JCM 8866 / NBRC 14739 / NCIMB 2177 / R-4) TaxID=523841 RepID=M0ISF2_HALMT|nr:hypothetical protein [Haloferax mediterranei]AHZ23206.1 hypothetical protein BM92_11415 [Haloferax mediterranei ATCC 33500]ELZ99786.1 hypothetical protein C439_12459 [Haloferax mediterranei ATCC 33500]MDX5987429.1 hypothetical protein [Haloferax mediterranei ATCC 33500]QCQ73931.1 hypothetical protein E6P09_01025 [Haloferax mediterranei ATCC 33500]
MTQTLEVAPHVITEGSTIRHATLCTEQTVVEIAEETIRTTQGDEEFVYPREQLALDLSVGRFEVIS